MKKVKQPVQYSYTPCAAGEPLPVRGVVFIVVVFLLILGAHLTLAIGSDAPEPALASLQAV